MKKRYKVVGASMIDGHAPGTTFEAELDKAQEDFLVGIGGLKVLGESKPKKDK